MYVFRIYFAGGEKAMGMIYEEITLKNAVDVGNCINGLISKQEVRQATVQAVVDTGAATLVIKVLLGAIPLENMDLIVDPAQQILVGRHGEEEVGYLY